MDKEWETLRGHINSRLVKLYYLLPNLKYEPFSVVEKEIKIEWKRNPLLVELLRLWRSVIAKKNPTVNE